MGSALTVVVVGATGRQGGAVARHLLAEGWRVRALTRRPDSRAGRRLSALGAEVRRVDLNEPDTLHGVFTNAYGAFSVQNPMTSGLEAEVQQGRNVAEAVSRAGVEHLVYASAGIGVSGTGVGSWESKRAIQAYMTAIGLRPTVLRPMAMMELMTDLRLFPAVAMWHLMPKLMGADRPLPWICADDVGAIAARAFASPDQFAGEEIQLASDVQSVGECRTIWREVIGRGPRRLPMPVWMFEKFAGADLTTMWRWLHDHRFDIDLSRTHQILPTATTVREWLIRQRATRTRAPRRRPALDADGPRP
jgi:uncharacterized protein YbjT (DUF2867 family)